MKVLVLVLRGLQTAFLGPYGNRWIDTPNFDLLAEAGTLRDWHFADRPGTCPLSERDWLAALRTANVPVRIVRDASRGLPENSEPGETFADPEKTLKAARKILRAGFSGLLWVELSVLLPPWRIASSFLDTVFPPPEAEPTSSDDEEDDDEDDNETKAAPEPEHEAEAEGLEYLPEEEALEPVLAPTLGVIDPNEDRLYLSLQSTYAAAVMQADAMMAELLDGLPDEVTLLVTSDQGFALGEHGHVGFTAPLHQERIHLPFFAIGPGIAPGGRLASLSAAGDLLATVATRLGVPWPGRDLLAAGAGLESVVVDTPNERGVRTAAWYLRAPSEGSPELYEKPADRLERLNLANVHFAIVEELLARLSPPSPEPPH
jgi:hypothetical protein